MSYHQDAAMSENVFTWATKTLRLADSLKKLNRFNFIQHLASASGLQQISVHTGIWMPITASETPMLTRLKDCFICIWQIW